MVFIHATGVRIPVGTPFLSPPFEAGFLALGPEGQVRSPEGFVEHEVRNGPPEAGGEAPRLPSQSPWGGAVLLKANAKALVFMLVGRFALGLGEGGLRAFQLFFGRAPKRVRLVVIRLNQTAGPLGEFGEATFGFPFRLINW